MQIEFAHQLIAVAEIFIPMQLESAFIQFPHIVLLPSALQILLQSQQFRIGLAREGQDWHSVFRLVEVGEGRVVHQQHLRNVPIYYPQILGVDSLVQFDAVGAVQPVGNQFFLRVEFVQNGIGVELLAGSEDDDFEVFAHALQETQGVGTQSDVDSLQTAFAVDVDFEVVLSLPLGFAVQQSFVEVQDKCLFVEVSWELGEAELEAADLGFFREGEFAAGAQNLEGDGEVFEGAFLDPCGCLDC